MTTPKLDDHSPDGETITPYDETHLVTYLRLLDADAEGADWQEVARIVLNLDVSADPKRAKAIHASHLERARWIARSGYRDLLNRK
ncbi:DNA -binding domain-containing protein [Novosphingobium jiangmenense]|uniref:DUF2285 domain-containing protein n=1 Tax=Novosphingobium jiangmenense TaxID=2791981 RepID=A0ABS0HHH6_9SPHN|nr:DUF2285 domain-containing protein [Novosphingobium jiangmenense]MBF9151692.1 DUF2285 domain-containing protein [Novosphingobium jiangmenense]